MPLGQDRVRDINKDYMETLRGEGIILYLVLGICYVRGVCEPTNLMKLTLVTSVHCIEWGKHRTI